MFNVASNHSFTPKSISISKSVCTEKICTAHVLLCSIKCKVDCEFLFTLTYDKKHSYSKPISAELQQQNHNFAPHLYKCEGQTSECICENCSRPLPLPLYLETTD